MKTLLEFTVPYLGLANGSHNYQFELGDSFFQHFEKSKVEKGHFTVDILFEKQDRTVTITIDATGHIHKECDRCLVMIDVPVLFEDRVIIKIQDKPEVQQDEVYYLDPTTSHIDLSPIMHESILLHLPIKNVRDCDTEDYLHCDQEVLNSLDRSVDSDPGDKKSPWRALKKLNLE